MVPVNDIVCSILSMLLIVMVNCRILTGNLFYCNASIIISYQRMLGLVTFLMQHTTDIKFAFLLLLSWICCKSQFLNLSGRLRTFSLHGQWFTGSKQLFLYCNETVEWAVVVPQLVEWSLPIPEVRGLNPVIGKKLFILNICLLSTVYWKDENKEKEAVDGPLF